MRLLPKDHAGRISFCQVHVTPWAERAAEIGTTVEQVAELAALTEAAQAALSAQQQAQDAARSATLRMQEAISKMSTAAQAIILQVRGEAARRGDAVYPLAMISPPEQGAPLPPPGQPSKLQVELLPNGSLRLAWQCKNPRGSQGTIYQVYRKLDGGPLTYIGGTGKKTFLDESLPPGTATALYQIRGERSTAIGEWALFSVNFGMPKGSPRNAVTAKPTQWTAAA